MKSIYLYFSDWMRLKSSFFTDITMILCFCQSALGVSTYASACRLTNFSSLFRPLPASAASLVSKASGFISSLAKRLHRAVFDRCRSSLLAMRAFHFRQYNHPAGFRLARFALTLGKFEFQLRHFSALAVFPIRHFIHISKHRRYIF